MYKYYTHSQSFLKENFNIELKVPIEVNGRLSSALGRFIINGGRADRIELSKNLLYNYNDTTIIDVLNHELVHYALYVLQKPYSDNDRYFIETCKRLNVSLSGVIKYKVVYQYKCDCRVLESTRRRRLKNYHCAMCESGFSYIGKRKL